jgi:hypothetical protein
MKTVKYIIVAIILIIVFGAGLTSCGSTSSFQKNDTEVVAYTLKNKTELMQQKVLNTNVQTVIAQP